MGAVKGNKNARKHGLYERLSIGRTPKGQGTTYRHARKYRLDLERRVEAEYGSISAEQGEVINAATEHEKYRCHCNVLAYRNSDKMTDEQVNSYLRAASLAVDRRNKEVSKLKLGAKGDFWNSESNASAWNALDRQLEQPDPEASPDRSDATDAKPEGIAGTDGQAPESGFWDTGSNP